MSAQKIKRALISVYDKTGVVDFARGLVDGFGVEIVSTGGTAALLKENDIAVTLVEDITGSGEMMDGRVKTLHPAIHAAILADRDNPDHMRQLREREILPIDMVVVNLYPFEETVSDPDCTFEKAIEMIDIGGPCLLRAAAKNHKHVLPIVHQELYKPCLEFLADEAPAEEAMFRRRMAALVFDLVSEYDTDIAAYLEAIDDGDEGGLGVDQEDLRVFEEDGCALVQVWEDSKRLRYGENPHQQGAYLAAADDDGEGVSPENVLAGDEMSFNNHVDADSALGLCRELAVELGGTATSPRKDTDSAGRPEGNGGPAKYVCAFIKHTNPCGVGVAANPIEAYHRAYLGDPNAAMGGILACSFAVGAEFATAVMETYDRWGKEAGAGGFFAEVWVAPSFLADVVEIVQSKKEWGRRVRLLGVGDMTEAVGLDEPVYQPIDRGILAQQRDCLGLNEGEWKVVTKRHPSDAEMEDLRLAWLVCKHTKSNAITICKDAMLIGNGAGQMSRVMSARIASWLGKENGHESKLEGSVAASDAFFPFRDGPEILMDSGVKAIIQPGGAKRDDDTIAACNERDVAMIFTGTRHFKH